MRGSEEQFNTNNISSIYSETLLPNGENIHLCAKYYACASMCYCLIIYILFINRSCELN